jgi:hypothetical protein
MKQARLTAEQIVGIRHEAAAGTQVRERCRRHGVTETTFAPLLPLAPEVRWDASGRDQTPGRPPARCSRTRTAG